VDVVKPVPFLSTLAGLLILAVLVPAAASAKVMPVAATACGSDGCAETDLRVARFEPLPWAWELMDPAIDPPRASPAPRSVGPWYSVDLRFGPPVVRQEARGFRSRLPVAYIPGPGYLRTAIAGGGPDGDWVELTSSEIAAFENAVEGVEPFDEATLPGFESVAHDAASVVGGGGSGGGVLWWALAGGAVLVALGWAIAAGVPRAVSGFRSRGTGIS
jgi:hypothetical protein